MQLKLRLVEKLWINPVGASSLTADTPKRRESEQGSSANESSLAGCIAAVNNLLWDVPTVDSSRDRTALSGKIPGRWIEGRSRTRCKTCWILTHLIWWMICLQEKHAYDMVWVDEWRGDRVRSRLCVRQFKVEGLRDDLFAGTPDTFFIKYLAKAASCKDFGILVIDISVAFMHARTDEEIYVKVPSGIKSSKNWKLKAAVNGTRKASKHWQEYSSDRLVTNMLFQQNDINPCIYKRFCDDLDLEQHGDDFLVCGVTRSLEKSTEEFNRNFVVKKSEIVSLKPEHQSETQFLKRRISVDEFGWHVELDQRCAKSLLDAMAMNHCKSMATPGSKGQEGNNATEKLDAKEPRVPIQCWNLSVHDRATLRHCLQHEGNYERHLDRPQPQRQSWSESRVTSKDASDVCWISLGSKDKVLNVWRSSGNWPVLHITSLVSDTGNSVTILSWVRGQGDHERLSWSSVRETFAGAPDSTNVQNRSLDGQQQRQGHHTTSWSRA